MALSLSRKINKSLLVNILIIRCYRHKISIYPPLNPLNAKLNPICHLLELLGAHHILHISRIRVNINM